MQEGKREDPEKTYVSKYGLETKCTYRAGTENQTRAHWCIAPGKNRYATCFPSIEGSISDLENSFRLLMVQDHGPGPYGPRS